MRMRLNASCAIGPYKMKSILFVLVQFGTLGMIAITGPIIPSNFWLFMIEAAGILLGVWAVLAMGIGNFNITPDPLSHGKLSRRGPYELIRHPMYMALLLVTAPLVIVHFSIFRAALWIILLVDLLLKLHYEERLLSVQLEGYQEYMSKSYRLIPFLY